MGTPPLSPGTEERVARLFAPADRDKVRKLLLEGCGNNLPFLNDLDEIRMERFRFAALKLSLGRVDKLEKAIAIGKRDWRDMLMWAGFGERLEAHLEWMPEVAPASRPVDS